MLLLAPSFHSAAVTMRIQWHQYSEGVIEEKEAPLHLDFSICHVIHSIAFESVENPPQQNNICVYLEEMLYVDVYISDPASFINFSGAFSLPLSKDKMASEILCKNRS